MKKTKPPAILIEEGTAELVLQDDAESYHKLLETKDRRETIEGIKRGLENMKRQQGTLATDFFREFFAENGILRNSEVQFRVESPMPLKA